MCNTASLKTTMAGSIANESLSWTSLRVLSEPQLRVASLRCIAGILRHFFLPQFRASFLPGRIPVSKVDHPLDSEIPFLPGKVNIYLDFVAFWVRAIGFILRNCGRQILVSDQVREFIESMGQIYEYAAQVYKKNLSTTTRPFYISSPRFFLIHALDPHLMCVPSLHVMVVIRTYTLIKEITKNLKVQEHFAEHIEELRQGALNITEAVLYVKQHSVNCIPAAMYAMTRYDPFLFPPSEAEHFASCLFINSKKPDDAEGLRIREHIISLYRHFLSQGEKEESAEDWSKPLLDFLKETS